MQTNITHLSGPRDGETMTVEAAGSPPEVTFGRLPNCTVSLPDDSEVSRRHARLVWRDKSWWLEDLDSTNGTFVGEFAQGQRITRAVPIEAGRVFRVGLSRFRVDLPAAIESARSLKAERFS